MSSQSAPAATFDGTELIRVAEVGTLRDVLDRLDDRISIAQVEHRHAEYIDGLTEAHDTVYELLREAENVS